MARAVFVLPVLASLLAGCGEEIRPWSRAFAPSFHPLEDSPLQDGNLMAVGPHGEVVVWGHFGSGVHGDPSEDANEMATLARFGADGHLRFAVSGAEPFAQAGVFEPSGELILCGSFDGEVDTAEGKVSALDSDSFVARFDAAGHVLWLRDFSSDLGGPGVGGLSRARTIARSPPGGLLVAGWYTGNFGLGGDPLYTAAAGETAAYVARLDHLGHHMWSRSLHGNGQSIDRVAADGLGNAFAAGGDGPEDVEHLEVFVSAFDFTGGDLWTIHIGNGVVSGLAGRPEGGALIAGTFQGSVDVGGTTLTTTDDSAGFLAALSLEGAIEWAERIDGVSMWTLALFVDSSDHQFLAGGYHGAPDFGGGPLPSALQGTFVLERDELGNHVWSRGFREPGLRSHATGIAPVSDGVVISGTFEGMLDLGTGPLVATGDTGAEHFIARLQR